MDTRYFLCFVEWEGRRSGGDGMSTTAPHRQSVLVGGSLAWAGLLASTPPSDDRCRARKAEG